LGGGLAGFVDTILGLLGVQLAPGMGALGVLVAALVVSPFVLANLRTDRVRRILKEASRAHGPVREALEAEALVVAGDRVWPLIAVADAAIAGHRVELAEACLTRLRAARAPLLQLRRLEGALYADLPSTPDEVLRKVARYRESGLDVAADDLLVRSRRRWPSLGDTSLH
jgi:hypothetical protein